MNQQQNKSLGNDSLPLQESGTAHLDREFDLFDLAEILWAGKRLILLTTMIAMLAAIGYLKMKTDSLSAQPVSHRVFVPMTINRLPYWAHNQCLLDNNILDRTSMGNAKSCLLDIMLKGIPDNWEVKNGRGLEHITAEPQSSAYYDRLFSDIENAISANAAMVATADLNFINSDMPPTLAGSEEISKAAIEAQRTLREIEIGLPPLEFLPATIEPITIGRNRKKIVLASMMAGLIAGSITVLILGAWRRRQAERNASSWQT